MDLFIFLFLLLHLLLSLSSFYLYDGEDTTPLLWEDHRLNEMMWNTYDVPDIVINTIFAHKSFNTSQILTLVWIPRV